MTLIECPECARQVSDRARECPGCAYPLGDPALVPAAAQRHTKRSAWPAFLLLIFAAAVITWFVARQPTASGIAAGQEAVLSARAGTFGALAADPHDLERLLTDVNAGASIGRLQALASYSVMPLDVGTRVKVLEIGRAGSFAAARVQDIGTPALIGWTAAEWLDRAVEQAPAPIGR